MILNNPDAHASSINYVDAVLGADSPYPLSPSSSSTPFPLYIHGVLSQGRASSSLGYWKVNNGLAVTMICLVTVVAAFGFYFFVSPSTTQTQSHDCVAAATVNTTTGMGMTAAVAECE